VLLALGINAWYGPYLYAIAIALNAATVYWITAWLVRRISRNPKPKYQRR
jgi:hypothetical protein